MVEESGHRLSAILAVFLCASMLTGTLVVVPGDTSAFPDTASFQGYVVDGLNPVSNAYVKAMLMMANGIEINYTFTDPSGYYHIGVPGGLQYMLFAAEGRYMMSMTMAVVNPGETKWVNFSLTPISAPADVTLMGYVYDEFGTPRSDGNVLGAVSGPGGADGPPIYANVTQPNVTGFFEVNITAAPDGGGAIAMDFPGYPMAQNMTSDPLLAGMTYWFNLTLAPQTYNDSATLAGNVVDVDSHAPLEYAVVSVEVEMGMGDRYSNFTFTDASGDYLMGTQSGSARIMIQKPGYSIKMFENYPLVPGANVVDAELKITEAKVRGNVTDLETGLPLVNAQVILSDNQGNISIAYTNDLGFYELDAFVGTGLYIMAQADAYSRSYVIVNITAGDELWYDLGLWPANAWLTGTVTDFISGLPISGLSVHVYSPIYDTWANVDGSGHFNVTLPAENYTVEAGKGDYWPYLNDSVPVVAGMETVLDIELVPFVNANISGTVTDAISGTPVPNAQVSAGSQLFFNSTTTDPSGNYSMAVAAGDYDVRVDAPSYQSTTVNVLVANFTDIVLNISVMPMTPPTTVLLTGNVTEMGTGLMVPFSTVRVNFLDRSYENRTSANDSGYYELYVPAWEIRITAWGFDHGPFSTVLNMSGEASYNLDIMLPSDPDPPMILSYSESPLENVSMNNQLSIDTTVQDAYLRDMTLMMLMQLNSSGTHSNYTLMKSWTTSYDPIDTRDDLSPTRDGDNYTMQATLTTAWDGVLLRNSTGSVFLPAMTFWTGSDFAVMLRGYYTNSTVTDVPGTGVFNYTSHAMMFFWTDFMESIAMPDPTGIFSAAAYVAEFDGTNITSFSTRTVSGMSVNDIECEWLGRNPSGYYKTIFSVSDWSHGNGRVVDLFVDNSPPVADAGIDQNAIENTTVTLDASGTVDDFWITSYSWSYVDSNGSTVNLNGQIVNCSFNATGVFNVTLTVADGGGWVAVDTVVITVGPDVPPTAVAGSDQVVDEDTLVSFDGSGSSDDVGIVNYTWTAVETGEHMYGVTPSMAFPDPGTYTVELVVVDSIGQSSLPSNLTVTVNDATAPVAVAGSSQTINLGSSVTLNASGSYDNVDIVNYTWSFTDVTYIELYTMEITHSFGSGGTYLVTLTVWDASGHSDNDSVSVTVNVAPVANAGPDQLVNVGSTVTFDGSGSADDLDSLAQLNLTWVFTYNSVSQTIYGVSPTFGFMISGAYTVTLTVTDTMALYSTDAMIVTVNAPPTADAGSDQTVNAGATVSFDGSGSADDLDSLAQLNLTWTFTYGGSPRTLWGAAPTFQFDAPGTYVATLTVTDSGGLGDTDTVTIYVNEAPIADAGSDQFVNSVAAVTLNASGTTDDFDSLASLNFTWNFTYGGSPVVRYGVTPTYTFIEGGVYTVTLTVTDSGGLADIDFVVISVNLAPVPDAGPDQDVNIGGTVSFDANASTDDADTLATLNFTWSFTYGGSARNLWGASPAFQFNEIGSYIVTLTVADSRGASSTDTMLVSVNGPPNANAGPDQTVDADDAVTFDGSMSSDDSVGPVLNYTWNATVGGLTVNLYDVHPTYTFLVAGSYTFTLTVRDAGGLTSTDTVTVTVNPANAAPVASAGPDQAVKIGDIVLFDGSGSSDDAGTTGLNYTWEFEYQDVVERRWGPQPTFIFNETGTYGVTLTVRDADGATSTDTVIITVEGKASKSFVSQYWWSIAIIAVAAVAIVALMLMRKKGSGGSAGESEELEEEPKKLVPPPDEEEL